MKRWLCRIAATLVAATTLLGVAQTEGPAQAAGVFKVTAISATIGMSGGLFLPWGWNSTDVSFADPSGRPSDTYRVAISPKVRIPNGATQVYLGSACGSGHYSPTAGCLMIDHTKVHLLPGHHYTITLTKVRGRKVMGRTAAFRWTPTKTVAPRSPDINTLSKPHGVEALVAGQTYRLKFLKGTWERAAKIRLQILAMDTKGAVAWSAYGDSSLRGGWYDTAVFSAAQANRGIAFKLPWNLAGTWIHVSVYGSAPNKLDWGWATKPSDGVSPYNIPVIANAADNAQWQMDSSQIPDTTINSSSSPPVTGSVLTASTGAIPPASVPLGLTSTYQWVRTTYGPNGNVDTDIPGATASTYTVTDADKGFTVNLHITFTPTAETWFAPLVATGWGVSVN